MFLWRDAISRFKCPKKFQPAGDNWLLKLRTLKVKYYLMCDNLHEVSSATLTYLYTWLEKLCRVILAILEVHLPHQI